MQKLASALFIAEGCPPSIPDPQRRNYGSIRKQLITKVQNVTDVLYHRGGEYIGARTACWSVQRLLTYCFYRFTSTRYSKPVKDATQSMNNAAVTHQDGVLTLSFERALDTGDDDDLSFADNCYYFIFPVGGGRHSNNDFSQHADTPVFSPNKICNGKSQIPLRRPGRRQVRSWSQTR